MARHWSQYAGSGLTDKQIRAADRIAQTLGYGDGLSAIAAANGISRSKATKESANRHKANQLIDRLFELKEQ